MESKNCPNCGIEHILDPTASSLVECAHCGIDLLVSFIFGGGFSVDYRPKFSAVPTEDGGMEVSIEAKTETQIMAEKLVSIASGLLATRDMVGVMSDRTIKAMLTEDLDKLVEIVTDNL